jgi:hypothetical protein
MGVFVAAIEKTRNEPSSGAWFGCAARPERRRFGGAIEKCETNPVRERVVRLSGGLRGRHFWRAQSEDAERTQFGGVVQLSREDWRNGALTAQSKDAERTQFRRPGALWTSGFAMSSIRPSLANNLPLHDGYSGVRGAPRRLFSVIYGAGICVITRR